MAGRRQMTKSTIKSHSSGARPHESNTSGHQASCQAAARALLAAADYALEAQGYTWTPLARGTIEQALARLDLARELLVEARSLVMPETGSKQCTTMKED